MNTRITFETANDLPPAQQQELIRLRGLLIQKGFADIIHLRDSAPGMHEHFFDLPKTRAGEALDFIRAYLTQRELDWCRLHNT